MPDTFLSANWENLIMANYAIDSSILQPYLPKGVELDLFANRAYVSLVGFMFKRTSLFHMPIPLLGTFEEVNLRFYVKRTVEGKVRRGVVFINETVPYKLVAWLANKLYKEHYVAIPTSNTVEILNLTRKIGYSWKTGDQWNKLQVNAANEQEDMRQGSVEEFIFEHYYGYTKVDDQYSQEYKVNHPRWKVHKIIDYTISCDFMSMYGSDFAHLRDVQPDSVILSAGSSVTIDWKRTTF